MYNWAVFILELQSDTLLCVGHPTERELKFEEQLSNKESIMRNINYQLKIQNNSTFPYMRYIMNNSKIPGELLIVIFGVDSAVDK